ncbi:unnamed protein product [Malus baccata var. baccata]
MTLQFFTARLTFWVRDSKIFISPSIAFEVIKWLNDPRLGLKFFELNKVSLSNGASRFAKLVFDCMRSDRHTPNDSAVELLVSSYAQMGKLDNAKKFLDEAYSDLWVLEEVQKFMGVWREKMREKE